MDVGAEGEAKNSIRALLGEADLHELSILSGHGHSCTVVPRTVLVADVTSTFCSCMGSLLEGERRNKGKLLKLFSEYTRVSAKSPPPPLAVLRSAELPVLTAATASLQLLFDAKLCWLNCILPTTVCVQYCKKYEEIRIQSAQLNFHHIFCRKYPFSHQLIVKVDQCQMVRQQAH